MGEKENLTSDAHTTKPDPYTAVRMYFADGSHQGGIWTGKVWWSEGRPVEPVRWERMTPPAEPKREER